MLLAWHSTDGKITMLLQVFIKSTAGMRMLTEETQQAIYDEIYDALGQFLFFFSIRSHVGSKLVQAPRGVKNHS